RLRSNLNRMALDKKMKQYEIIARRRPSEKVTKPKSTKMQIFAENEVRALSRFFFFLQKYNHIKRSSSEVLSIKIIKEENPFVAKNYGICIRVQTRTNIVNMYKEYRALSRSEAVERMYDDIAARHRARKSCIEIIKVDVLPNEKCLKPETTTFHGDKVEFPQRYRLKRNAFKSKRKLYSYSKPNYFVF
ncbi:60S ribosomal protein L20B, partial [Bonamia ostreae]